MANRVLTGNHSSLGYGLYVSKPGKDVTTATGADLIFDSSRSYSSALHQIVDVTISSGNSSGTGTISGLAYVPFVTFTEYDTNGVRGLRFVTDKATGGGTGGGGGGGGMGAGGGGGGRGNIRFTHWKAYTTNTTITISTWPTSDYFDNNLLVFPSNTGLDTGGTTVDATKYFRCFVYKIPATA